MLVYKHHRLCFATLYLNMTRTLLIQFCLMFLRLQAGVLLPKHLRSAAIMQEADNRANKRININDEIKT